MLIEQLKRIFRKPTPLERAAKELGQIEHSMLDASAEIMWAQKRMEYYKERKQGLQSYVQEASK